MSKDSQINSFFDKWVHSENISENITHIQTKNNYFGKIYEIPSYINSELKNTLQEIGINSLYSHQLQAIELIMAGKNTVLTTGPSSGKSLAYKLPILNSLYQNENSNALLLFPTKALAYDQLTHFKEFINNSHNNILWKKDASKKISVYDGDTPKEIRSSIRKHAQVILTNPDMLHVGILPNHFLWENFFENLKYIILDESHIYRGIFGSHVANVIRRLKRILALYNQRPVFICTSATIGNPIEFLNKLVEDEFEHVSEDGSPQGRKQIVFYNPPLLNEELGIRKNSHQEALNIVNEFLENGVQSLVFQGTRKEVEKSLKKLEEQNEHKKEFFSAAYRSGYLASDRRKLEEEFRSGKINVLFSTNALELGVDIGGLKCVILSGYPGSISSTLQQIGRAGRKQSEALAILIASINPIDQYIIKRPEYLFINNPEKAIINPNNPNILLEHLKISLNELSFMEGEKFGNLDWLQTKAYLELLIGNGFARKNNNKYLIFDPSKFSNEISLRNLSGNTLKLIDVTNDHYRIIGEIDYASSLWMVHPNAIYLHLGIQYYVKNLNFENNEVLLEESNVDYFTEPKIEKTYEIIEQTQSKSINNLDLYFGKITKKYQRIRWNYLKLSSILKLSGFIYLIQSKLN
jgi:DEAD/DEAH box helicase domain-containing protein